MIAELLDRVDQTLVALVASEDDALAGVRAAMDVLTDALLSHFAYEERELIEPLARFGYASASDGSASPANGTSTLWRADVPVRPFVGKRSGDMSERWPTGLSSLIP